MTKSISVTYYFIALINKKTATETLWFISQIY